VAEHVESIRVPSAQRNERVGANFVRSRRIRRHLGGRQQRDSHCRNAAVDLSVVALTALLRRMNALPRVPRAHWGWSVRRSVVPSAEGTGG
jgi:hypothetical protein